MIGNVYNRVPNSDQLASVLELECLPQISYSSDCLLLDLPGPNQSTEGPTSEADPPCYDREYSLGHPPSGLSQPPMSRIRRHKKRRRYQGWRFGIALNASIVTLTLATNIVLVTVASYNFRPSNGIGTFFVGDCSLVNRWNVGIHLLINILSSALLGASNYAMQCISSPTRSECDAAHARGDWLDIGVPGIRNIWKISTQRRTLWILLLVSSIPIHLLFNSVVFKTLDTNEYRYALLGNNIGDVPALNASQVTDLNRGVEATRIQYLEETEIYHKMDVETCISVYGRPFVSGYSNVILVTADESYNYSDTSARVQYWDVVELSHNNGSSSAFANGIWACDSIHFSDRSTESSWHRRSPGNWYCHGSDFSLAANWTVFNHTIDHCIARKATRHCKLQFSIYLMFPVILCNLIKAVSMFYALIKTRQSTLVTLGDALASWLDYPDEFSKGRCLASKDDVLDPQIVLEDRCRSFSDDRRHGGPDPMPFKRKDDRDGYWCGAVSLKRWTFAVLSCYCMIGLAFALLPISSVQLDFGSFNPQLIIGVGQSWSTSTALLGCVLLVNLPQLLLSIGYVLYNGLFTTMHLAHEYNSYARDRKPLRVTDPTGEQRSTYWLQLPFRYSIPLLLTSSTLHWLVSQSIFLARVAVWRNDRGEPLETATGRIELEDPAVSVVGYSGLPLLCVVALGVTMMFVALAMGFKKLPSRMPIAGSCSLAIAAAAHRPDDDLHASVLPVKWGVVADNGAVGHVCFTSKDVTRPQNGRLYA